jgi:histidinol-phosphate aminotransferase
MYEVLANINAVATNKIALTRDFQPQVDQILNASSQNSKLLFLCSPNNPSGNNFNPSAMERLILNFQGLVVIDEAYIDFSEQQSWLNRLNEFPNLIITQTLSKAYGMAGIRLGICYASEAIISILNKIKPPYNVNELTQLRALEQLNNPDVVKDQVRTILTERTKLIEALNTITYVSKIYPTDANFVLVKVDDANTRYNQLIENGIVIRNRANQPLCENCLRLTIGTPTENKILINILKEIS